MTGEAGKSAEWLLLIHQLPAKPAYLRVKIWRRLHTLGAVAVKNAVYALPAGEQTQEDFEWLRREIVEGGGEAMICQARLVDGLADHEARALFNTARDSDYDAIARDVRALAAELDAGAAPERRLQAEAVLARLRHRFAQVEAIDFFGANGRETVEGLLAGIAAELAKTEASEPTGDDGTDTAPWIGNGQGRTWVTRRGVQIDRIASAWLIRRFIDPEARFKFVAAKGYAPEPAELRFDMFDAEFTHEGDRCTFEVLLARAGIGDRALAAIGEIVHDVDLKDEKFGRAEATGIKHLIAGIAMAHDDDGHRVARGAAVFDDLYEYFRRQRG